MGGFHDQVLVPIRYCPDAEYRIVEGRKEYTTLNFFLMKRANIERFAPLSEERLKVFRACNAQASRMQQEAMQTIDLPKRSAKIYVSVSLA